MTDVDMEDNRDEPHSEALCLNGDNSIEGGIRDYCTCLCAKCYDIVTGECICEHCDH
jgi:hypothetical protein